MENLYKLDGKVPILKAIPFGLQHILAMFIAGIEPPLLRCCQRQPLRASDRDHDLRSGHRIPALPEPRAGRDRPEREHHHHHYLRPQQRIQQPAL